MRRIYQNAHMRAPTREQDSDRYKEEKSMAKFDYPEEVEQRHMDTLDAVKGISLDKLQKLVAAYSEGRVVVLPDCKKCKNYAARDALYPQCIGVVYPCEGCVGLIKIKRYPNNKFEAALAGEGAE